MIAAEGALKPRELPRWLRRARGGARGDARHAGGARADRARRRPPAAAAARAGDARARVRPRRARSAPRRSLASLGVVRRAQGCGRSRTRWWRATSSTAMRRAASSCGRRASGSRRCSTRWSAGCARRSRSPRRWPPGARRAEIRKGLRMPSFAADRLIADARRARRRAGCGARWRRWPTSSSRAAAAAAAGGGLGAAQRPRALIRRRRRSTRRLPSGLAREDAFERRSDAAPRMRGAVAPLSLASARGAAGAQPRGAGLLARAGVAVQGAALDRLVDQGDQLAVLGVGRVVVALADRGLQAAEVRLDRRRVAAVLDALALGAQDALLLGGDVGHTCERRGSRRGGRVL